MGRPEPCVLFAQTFAHPQLDEYVDEVLFSEPVVISSCEFLEQSASSVCSDVQIVGATLPPSFAMEVFVQCEKETKFRRLCQPFLYSHSSSNALEIEAVVTNHLVIRGSYRSLSLVIYGNTAEDLGQFNIEVDLDNSLANTVSSVEGNLEDLPPALPPTNVIFQENLSPLKSLSLRAPHLDISIEIKQVLQLTLKILGFQNAGHITNRLVRPILSVASVYTTSCLHSMTTIHKQLGLDTLICDDKVHNVLGEARKELLEMYKELNYQEMKELSEFSTESVSTALEADSGSTKQLVDALIQYFKSHHGICSEGNSGFLKKESTIIRLAVALILCTARESCFHFVYYGGMEQLGYVYVHNSTALKLMLLGVIERATQHSVGCEGFLGWWPRKDESIPSGFSDGYNNILKLLMKCQRHDVALLSTYILHRMRFYEAASRYEHAVLSILEGHYSVESSAQGNTVSMLANAKLQLKRILKLLNSRGPIEDPSPVACASKSLLLGDAGQFSYESTSGLISLSNCCHPSKDVDMHLLSLLKEKGFLPLSAALLSYSALRCVKGGMLDYYVDIVSYLEAIVLTLLSCRSGLVFLSCNPEQSTTFIHALRGTDNWKKEEPVSLRYASALISKGFFFHPHKIAMIMEMHLKAVNAVDLLVTSNLHSEDFLWILWKLCGHSRSDGGIEALLTVVHFPEAVAALIATLHSAKDLDPSSLNAAASPLNHAIFHSAAEIFEIIVSDSTPSSLSSWIEHVKELHRLLLSTSAGSNKKDAPARLLDWIDAGVVYHRSGTIGLLRYTAVLASGGDAHMTSTSVLASDLMDIDNFIGDSSNTFESNVIDSILGKHITEKDFPGVILRDSSVVQLTTAFRILAFLSDNPTVAAALYDEGAVMVIHAVLINCRLLLERSSNVYDYLVDEGTECNSTSDILLERNREQSLLDLLIPSMVLLINLLQKLQEAKEQHRNTKLISSLVQLHREVSPKLAACGSDLSYSCPKMALSLGTVCHLLVSALACWSIYGWTPGLFHYLLDNLNATSVVALGPKETCSLLFLLNDLFPDECSWLWKDGMPMLATHRTVAVRTLLGPKKEEKVNWFLQPGHSEKLLAQLTPQLGKVSQIILHCSVSTLIVVQDLLRVFITRITNLSADYGAVLVRPIIVKVHGHLSDISSLSEVDAYKVHHMLLFISLLLEHPHAKNIILKAGAADMLSKVLQKCLDAANIDHQVFLQNRNVTGNLASILSWCTPAFKSISLISDPGKNRHKNSLPERHIPEAFTDEECTLILAQLLTFFKILPVETELLTCLSAFKEMGCSTQGKSSLHSIFLHIQSTDEDYETERWSEDVHYIMKKFDWKDYPPLAYCWRFLLNSIASQNIPLVYAVEAIGTLSLASLHFFMDADSAILERGIAIRYLFGFKDEDSGPPDVFEESMRSLDNFTSLFGSIGNDYMESVGWDMAYLDHVKESAKLLMLLLHEPSSAVKPDEIASFLSISPIEPPTVSSKIHRLVDRRAERIKGDSFVDELGENFLWECPENLRERLTQIGLASKRRGSSMELGSNRRGRGDPSFSVAEIAPPLPRVSVPPAVISGPSRRDTFRQRKPNTSRPPSMHVDDYVARERNADGSSNSNVITLPRTGSSSGRPPSIHVDEFIAREKGRHISMMVPPPITEEKVRPVHNKPDMEKSPMSCQIKPDLDDDLQGIDIVFDAEESQEPDDDDKLPFPHPDDHLQHNSTPRSIVEETTSEDTRQSSRVVSNTEENTQGESSSRISVSRPEMGLTREQSVSSERKFTDQSEKPRSSSVKTSSKVSVDSPSPTKIFSVTELKQNSAAVPHESNGHKSILPQANLPSMLPLATASPITVQPDYKSMRTVTSASLTSNLVPDPNYSRTSLSSSTRPFPPLPPTPPPFAVNSATFSSLKPSTSQCTIYNQNVLGTNEAQQADLSTPGPSLTPFSPPPLVSHLMFSRPYGSNNSASPHQHADNSHSISQLHPLQVPQMPRHPPSQHLRPFVQMQMQQPLQMMLQQQPQHSQAPPPPPPIYYNNYTQQQQQSTSHSLPQQQQQLDHLLPQGSRQHGNGGSQQQDNEMSLQDFFKSPEAIQSLLSDRGKLCQLLVQHPKLMQMLQDRLGQL
ncbi:unnamed protein product [Cuscuta epithymum]|uniref:Virilizer N-terminal domain-containing protein n=2 Tax=Cuscuta epithymum TaxID=186058 RepID=A0AAV0FJ31_9ASTE|nr:unnamed protein product [Cuscuta epithymum]